MSGHKGKIAKGFSESEKSQSNQADPASSQSMQTDPVSVNLVAPFHKNTILVSVGGRKTQALVDTGASISCVSTSFLNKTSFQNSKLSKCNLQEIVGVGGEKHKIIGQIEIPLLLSGAKIAYQFYVLDTLHHSLILGMDFLKFHKVTIDLEAGRVHIKDKTLCAALIKTKAGLARVDKLTTIPPGCEVEIPVKVSKRQNHETVLLEPVSYLGTIGLGGAKCLVKVLKGKALFRVLNPTNKDVELPVNRVIASVCDIDNKHIHMLDGSQPAPKSYSAQINAAYANNVPDCDKLNFKISNKNLTEQEKDELHNFLIQNKDVFSSSLADIGKTNLYQHKIETVHNAPPVRRPFYRQPPHLKAETDRQVNDMLQQGIVQQSTSVYNSPVVLVRKKDGTWRFAVDYRQLNKITVPISHPIPRLEDVFDALGDSKATIFSILDLNSAYFQIELDPETRHKSAFVTHDGVYEFLRMPFGLRNAPMSFQMLMSQVLKGLNWKFVLCYIDDILVFSSNFKEHIHHLGQVFQRLRDANLTLKAEKCNFAVDRVVYLGHVITKDGVEVDIAKTEKIRTFPEPRSQKELKSFLGLANYYKRFVKDFSKICVPLNRLLQKDKKQKFAPGDWSEKCQKAFDTLKEALTSPPVLGYANMNKPFVLSTDASGSAIGYILGQVDETGKEQAIAFGGRALHPDEKKWTITELECLAVIVGMETFKHYLKNNKFTVYTDHKALQWLHKTKDPTGRLGRWVLRIQEFNYEIVHREGKRNQNADAISRIPYSDEQAPTPSSTSVAAVDHDMVSESNPTLPGYVPCDRGTTGVEDDEVSDAGAKTYLELNLEYAKAPTVALIEQDIQTPKPEMSQLQQQCNDFKDIFRYLQDQKLPDDEQYAKHVVCEASQYVLKDGTLYHMFQPRVRKKASHDLDQMILQLALPKVKRLEVIHGYHDCIAGGGHFGVNKTFGAIRLKYWWPKMYQMIQDYVKNCDVCQRIKVDRHHHPVPLHPLPVDGVFSRLHMDILCSLPKTKEGYQYILVIVDSFSKWCESFPMRTQEATEVASILYNEIFTRYGAPHTIVSDRGRNFMSKLVKALCEMFEITRHYTSSYHPETNATVERVNSTLSQTLRAYVNKDQSNWPSLLPSVMMAFRSTPCSESTQFTPFQLLFGREMTLPIDTSLIPKPTLGQDAKKYFESLIQKLKVSQEIATENLKIAKEKAKLRHDQNAKEPTFQLNDLVLLRNTRVREGLSTKLADKYTGPYYIVEVGPNHTYKLRNCADNKLLASLMNASRLKLYHDHPNGHPLRAEGRVVPLQQTDNDTDANPDNALQLPPPTADARQAPLPAEQDDAGTAAADDIQTPNNQPTRGQTEGSKQPQKDQNDAGPQVYFPIDRLLRVKRIHGKQHFLVKWQDGSPNTWEPEGNISEAVLRTYYSTHTKQGRRRKRKQLRFFVHSQN